MHAPSAALSIVFCAACAGAVYGQEVTPPSATEPAAAAKEGKVLRAFRVSTSPPRIDGRLDDEVWIGAEAIEGLVQWEPANMAPLTERTVVQVAYDDRHLYVAVRCYDATPHGVKGPLSRRDELRGTPTDLIGVGTTTSPDMSS